MSEPDKAVGAGRGVLYIAIAKFYFLFAGFAIEIGLTRLLGRERFGAYALVNGLVSNINNVMVTGTVQAVSRQTTADPEAAGAVKAAGLRMQAMVALPLAILYALLAPLWAWLEHDPGKAGLIALSGGIIAIYAFYTVFVGSANGTRQFHKQAALDMTAATLRVGGILGAAALGLGVWGAVGAWVGAAAAVLLVAAVLIGVPKDLRAGQVAPMLRYLAGVAVYLIIVNLIMSADLVLLKRLITEWFMRHPEIGDPTQHADGQVGYYRQVQNLARLPYQLMIAVTFVVFPLVSRSVFEKDADKTRSYVRTTMRYSLIFAGLIGSTVAAQSGPMFLLLGLTPDYATECGLAASILAIGNVAFAIFTIAGTVLNGAGRTLDAIIVAAGMLLLLVVALFIGIPLGTPGREVLAICAAATTVAMVLGAAASGWLLWRRFGAFMSPLTVIRVALASAATIAAGRVLVPASKVMTLVEGAVCAGVFLVVIVLTGELGKADLAVLRRRKA